MSSASTWAACGIILHLSSAECRLRSALPSVYGGQRLASELHRVGHTVEFDVTISAPAANSDSSLVGDAVEDALLDRYPFDERQVDFEDLTANQALIHVNQPVRGNYRLAARDPDRGEQKAYLPEKRDEKTPVDEPSPPMFKSMAHRLSIRQIVVHPTHFPFLLSAYQPALLVP